MRILAVVPFVLLLSSTPANAANVPDSALDLRIISRAELTMSVEVTNPSDQVARFDAIGLYFVPDAPSDEPQRLGVITAARVEELAPHASIRVQLTTYCLDVKRDAPAPNESYHLASRRMPPSLTTALAGAAQTVASVGYDPEGVRPDARAVNVNAATQKAVWRVRAAMPVHLLGDRRRDAE